MYALSVLRLISLPPFAIHKIKIPKLSTTQTAPDNIVFRENINVPWSTLRSGESHSMSQSFHEFEFEDLILGSYYLFSVLKFGQSNL